MSAETVFLEEVPNSKERASARVCEGEEGAADELEEEEEEETEASLVKRKGGRETTGFG
jgi:hypothetical protein